MRVEESMHVCIAKALMEPGLLKLYSLHLKASRGVHSVRRPLPISKALPRPGGRHGHVEPVRRVRIMRGIKNESSLLLTAFIQGCIVHTPSWVPDRHKERHSEGLLKALWNGLGIVKRAVVESFSDDQASRLMRRGLPTPSQPPRWGQGSGVSGPGLQYYLLLSPISVDLPC